MAIGTIEMATIARSQDYTTLKANEDNKAVVDQGHFGQTFTKEIEQKSRQVMQGEKAEQQQKKFDAKEKGNGQYYSQEERKKKEDRKHSDGTVTLKQNGGFDIKI